jgi:phosphoribosylamine--glycine ligase
MKILVVGGGGREHALAWALARRGHTIVCAPGNPGTARVGRNVAVTVEDIPGQVAVARAEGVDLVVVGPEAPLCAGIADAMRAGGITVFGPGRDGAQLEGSKAWSKAFFARHGLPTARFFDCRSMAEVDRALDVLGAAVVKADGLAAGKGVVVAATRGEARAAAASMIEGGAFGDSGRRVVVEERLLGREVSIHALTDGKDFVLLPSAEDHKAVLDGDRGPNTGGMGALSPTPVVTPELARRARSEVFEPVLDGLRAEGIDYRGVLYAGLMVAPDGTPNVLEFNCRFGDPEVEAILARWADDPAAWLAGAAAGRLPAGEPEFSPRAAVCVVMAAEGYPGTPRGGDAIAGIDDAEALGDVHVFQAGTRADGGAPVTAGGRVLAVTAVGDDAGAARARAYAAVAKISWPGAHFRTDIGGRTS